MKMTPPNFVYYDGIDKIEKYRKHYEEMYCKKPILTFDNIRVFFSKEKFGHAFYESTNRDGFKNLFSKERSKRINWIKATLENSNAEIFQGWNREKRCYENNRRVAIVFDNFVVIVFISKNKKGILKGNYITSYWANESATKIRKSPLWNKMEI